MGALRKQPQSEVLQPDRGRPASASPGDQDLGGLCCCRRQGSWRYSAACGSNPCRRIGMKPIPIWRRYARLFGPDPAADVKDELHFHIEAKIDDLIRIGHSPEA